MNEQAKKLLSIMRERKSYRRTFTDQKLTKEEIQGLCEAAYLAPSGCNLQTPRIIALTDPQIVKAVAECYGKDWAMTAPQAIVIVGQAKSLPGKGASRYREDFAAAAQNLLLLVEAMGYATVWVQGQIEGNAGEGIRKILNVPSNYEILGYFPIGKAAEKGSRPKKMSMEERIFENGFDMPM